MFSKKVVKSVLLATCLAIAAQSAVAAPDMVGNPTHNYFCLPAWIAQVMNYRFV